MDIYVCCFGNGHVLLWKSLAIDVLAFEADTDTDSVIVLADSCSNTNT